MRVADYVMQRVAEAGISDVFMVAGGGAMHLVDALGLRADLRYTCTLHEQAAAIAAEAYARVTNNLGAVLVTTGPGGTNALTGVAGAWLESTPMLVMSGQVKRADLRGPDGPRQRGPQELDIVAMAKPITKFATTVMDPQAIAAVLDEALYLARSGRPGPVWLDIPLDVQGAQVDPESLPRWSPPTDPSADDRAAALRDQILRVAGLLSGSERPVLIIGNGVRLAGAASDLLELVDALGIPVLTTWMGTDLLWEGHPQFLGKPGTVAGRGANLAVQNSDLVISIGARLDPAVIGFDQHQFARAADMVVVDIDPAELAKLTTDRAIPICADAGDFIRGLLAIRSQVTVRDRGPWLARCHEWKQRYPIVRSEFWQDEDYVNTYVFSKVLAEELAENDLVVPGSSGVGIDTFWLSFDVKRGQRLFSTGGLGAMGFGIPASIGACIAGGGRRTVSVDGDGGFQLNIQELETVARLRLPIKYFVLNNNGYASIRASQRNHFGGRLVGSDPSSGLTLPALGRIGAAYRLPTVRITSHDELREAIRRVLAMEGPVLCEVLVAPDQTVGPRVASFVQPDGGMVSRPLEDLFPFLDRDELRANMLIPLLPESETAP